MLNVITHPASLATMSVISTPVCMVVGAVGSLVLVVKALALKIMTEHHQRANQGRSKACNQPCQHSIKAQRYQADLNQTVSLMSEFAKLLIPLGGLYWVMTSDLKSLADKSR